MNILFTLCGRAGSKGVKGKNSRDFLGLPLVWYSMAAFYLYRKSFLTWNDSVDIALNTDSDSLIQVVNKVDSVYTHIINRKPSLGGDKVPKVDVILDTLNIMEKKLGRKYDIVVDLDITSPLRTVQDVKNAVDKKISRSDVDVVFSVVPSRRNPYFNMVRQENSFFIKAVSSNFTTRQEAPVFYDMNASVYAYSPEALRTKEHSTFFNSNCDVIEMFDTGILDIDSEEDYELMQVLASHLFNNKKEYGLVYNQVTCWFESFN